MICDRCTVDKVITVALQFALTKIDRNGRESRVTISKRLCRECGGAESTDEDRPVAQVVLSDEGGDEQAELELGAG